LWFRIERETAAPQGNCLNAKLRRAQGQEIRHRIARIALTAEPMDWNFKTRFFGSSAVGTGQIMIPKS
jgi:hypothetical protein